MKSMTKHYTLVYDNVETIGFETLVEVPLIGYCVFYAFKICSNVTCHWAGSNPRIIGKAFRFSKDFVVEVFINRIVRYR